MILQLWFPAHACNLTCQVQVCFCVSDCCVCLGRLLPGSYYLIFFEIPAQPSNQGRSYIIQYMINSLASGCHGQVRQPLYRTAMGRWRAYEAELEALRLELEPIIDRYEARLAAVAARRGAAAAEGSLTAAISSTNNGGTGGSVKEEL